MVVEPLVDEHVKEGRKDVDEWVVLLNVTVPSFVDRLFVKKLKSPLYGSRMV